TRKKELANRPLIREQAFGESLDPDKLERLGRYEGHLDRKLERMLAMLLRLKDLRRMPGGRLIRFLKNPCPGKPKKKTPPAGRSEARRLLRRILALYGLGTGCLCGHP